MSSFYAEPPDVAKDRRFWFIFFLLGNLLALAGIAAMIYAVAASYFSVLVWGYVLIGRGVLEAGIAGLTRGFSASLLHVLLGVLGIVIGVLIISRPEKAIDVMTLLLAVFLLIGGAGQALAALFVLFPGWPYALISGLIGVGIGLYLLPQWRTNDWFIGLIVGLEMFSRGSAWVGLALNLKNRKPRWTTQPGEAKV
jgi:uncharacterized membrane protein HdeD (DUF308 family)